MSLNSSSSPGAPPLPHSSNSSSFEYCLTHKTSTIIMIVYAAFCVIFILPIFILILHIGHQRWMKQRSVGTASMISHSDFFTYNMVALEIIALLGCCITICGSYAGVNAVVMAGTYLFSITSPGQTMFHGLTCMERFLAVVYPVIYLQLRQGGGVKIRNTCTVCVWLLCLLGVYIIQDGIYHNGIIMGLGFWAISLIIITFFSFPVVCLLIRPRPVDGGRDRSNQSKQRALNIIMVILVILVMRCFGFLFSFVIFTHSALNLDKRCTVIMSLCFLSLPSSLVLPLLFLHRAGKLPGWKQQPESR